MYTWTIFAGLAISLWLLAGWLDYKVGVKHCFWRYTWTWNPGDRFWPLWIHLICGPIGLFASWITFGKLCYPPIPEEAYELLPYKVSENREEEKALEIIRQRLGQDAGCKHERV